MSEARKPHSIAEDFARVRRGLNDLDCAASPSDLAALARIEEQNESLRELVEEAHRFALVLAELKVQTRPFAEAWLAKYRASFPASSPKPKRLLGRRIVGEDSA